MKRETVCSQVLHCLSCPLSPLRTGKDCRELTAEELAEIREEVEYLKKLGYYTRLICE